MTDVIHEGDKVFAEGKSRWRTIAELYAYFAVAGLLLPFVRDASFAVSFAIAAVGATAFALLVLVISRGRLQITPTEVRVRRAVRTKVIPRDRIAEVVHVEHLVVLGTIKGYLALLDHTGEPLWRSATNAWRPETINALVVAGQRMSVVEEARPDELRTRWPRLLPWSLAHPVVAFWVTVLATLAVAGALIGLAALLG